MTRTFSQVLLSLWIVFHLATMIIMPNASSYLGRLTSNWLAAYAGAVGLNANWNFYSPDPAHTMYIVYRVYFADEYGEVQREPLIGYMPPEKNQTVYNPLHRREMYAMRFFALDPKKLRALYGSWLCRKNPGASFVEVEHVIETIPQLDQMALKSVYSVSDFSKEVQFSKVRLDCNSAMDEEIL